MESEREAFEYQISQQNQEKCLSHFALADHLAELNQQIRIQLEQLQRLELELEKTQTELHESAERNTSLDNDITKLSAEFDQVLAGIFVLFILR